MTQSDYLSAAPESASLAEDDRAKDCFDRERFGAGTSMRPGGHERSIFNSTTRGHFLAGQTKRREVLLTWGLRRQPGRFARRFHPDQPWLRGVSTLCEFK